MSETIDRLNEIEARLDAALSVRPLDEWTDEEGYIDSALLNYAETVEFILRAPEDVRWLVDMLREERE